MKLRNPKSRSDLKIGKNDYVLEVGGGHNPHPRSNVVCDKFIDSNYHRSGDIKVRKNQEFLQADGENLPFKDKEFDYVICNQVLEHVDNPAKFLDEQMRVAKRGYLEAPSLFGEYLFPKESHRWLILEIENKIVMVEKKTVFRTSSFDISDIFLHHLQTISIPYKMLMRTYPELRNAAIEWENNFEYLIEPTDPAFLKYFNTYWDSEMIRKQIRPRSKGKEMMMTIQAFGGVVGDFLRNSMPGEKL
jgi:ubiquinone/menaquinone biosynthesis C-methylase UbiE